MFLPFNWTQLKKFSNITLFFGIFSSCFFIECINIQKAFSNPSFLEFRWNQDRNYRKLYFTQSSNERRDRSTYYLVIRSIDRKTGILKLGLTFPDHFDSSISSKNLSLCKAQLGDMLKKTKCLKQIPADFEITSNKSKIEVFPQSPIPADGDYAVVMRIFNPTSTGMYQINAIAQAPGDIPISTYLGSWNFDIE